MASLIKHFSYIIILSSTFMTHSHEIEDFKREMRQNPLIIVHKFNKQKQKDSDIFKEDTNKQILINDFITTHPLKTNTLIKMDFLQLYVNNPSFREWFYQLQIYITLRYVGELPEESLTNFKQPLLEKTIPSSWSKFYDIYTHNMPFHEWVFEFQKFILSYDIKSDKKIGI